MVNDDFDFDTPLDEQINAKLEELNRLKERKSKEANGQKIIFGGWLLNEIKKDKQLAKRVYDGLKESVKRERDIKRIAPIMQTLEKNLGIISPPPPVQNDEQGTF